MSSRDEYVRVFNRTRETILATHCRIASSLWSRTVGLLAHSSLPEDEGLWIHRCASIHMFGMRFAIDVVFLDKTHQVVDVACNVRPNRIRMCTGHADSTLELAVGTISRSATQVGDRIEFQAAELPHPDDSL